jgi:hypothetical protein
MLIPMVQTEMKSVVYFRNYWQKKVPHIDRHIW